ncbi:heavy metal translocating P-type ATPase [Leucobacter sp. M11]|uniref:heavy metal translocating P-type ATPase n=1 Tax=Leucobacter sp. M11 TaxID=2993565 RepID=UPI002D804388|nr:heavy metal translocating P-type ATPase [Leucobacter sp. M11]MEB4613908.1 heavy metal translocating P-type ATPase [Leucobacter sp. M11]
MTTYAPPSTPPDRHDHDEHGDHGARELGFAMTSGITFLLGFALELFPESWTSGWMPGWLPLAFFLATYFFGGFYTFGSAIQSIRRGRFEVDFLMLFAALGAAAVGRFAEGAVLLFLFSLGHALEEYAMGRASRSIEALAELAPATALRRLPSGDTVETPTEDLVPGDVVLVRPHARIPSDGVVVLGSSEVDQASLTGESIPVSKTAAPDPEEPVDRIPDRHRVFAGTVNGSGALELRVSVAAADNTLARVVALVRDADQTASPTQRFIERFTRWYVPAVILIVALVLLFGVVFLTESFGESFYRSMLVLVAASPCALAISTPAAVLSGVARAARAGLLVKGGAALESLGKVTAVAFDKTGTLTWGQPRLTDLVPAEGATREELARSAYALESGSDHPLAGAIVRGVRDDFPADSLREASDVVAVTGRGLRGVLDGAELAIGSLRLFEESGAQIPEDVRRAVASLQDAGRTTMVLRSGERFLGVLGVMDPPRGEARHVMSALRERGVEELVMISGDNQRVADAVGSAVGVDRCAGELLPEDKVTEIQRLSSGNRQTAMIGDGVNDAPAMANATVGIAMGAAGSAVALETADVALMGDDIGRLPFLLRLSRASSRIIRQNLIIALAIVIFLIPASLSGLPMGPVVFLHEGSALLVVLNALRLLRFENGREHAGIEHEERPVPVAA